MLHITKINPMVRAIGTVGAVAALVGGITFAQMQSNAVALSPNDVTTGTAHLQIAADATGCSDAAYGDGPVAGFNVAGLTSDSSTDPTPINFCIKNNGAVPLTILGSIPQNVETGNTASGFVTLDVSCTSLGDNTGSLNTWYAAGETFGTLGVGDTDACTASLSLNSGYSGSGGETVPTFDISFIGDQPSS